MPAKKKNLLARISVNLLYPQGVPQQIYIRFIKWLLNYGRFIVIVVEIVVISAFVARFKLDSDNADLGKTVKQKYQYMDSFSKYESLIRKTQFKLDNIQQAFNNSPDWEILFGKISSQVPDGVKLRSIGFDKPEKLWNFRLSGSAVSNSDLALFLSGMRQDSSFQDLNLASLGFGKGAMTFTLTGTLIGEREAK